MRLVFATSHGPPDYRLLLLLLVAIAIVAAGAWLAENRFRADVRRQAFRRAMKRLGGADTSAGVGPLLGRLRGFSFALRLVEARRRIDCRFEVEVHCEPFDLALRLVKERDVSRVEKRDYDEMTIGDPTFDSAWIIEGAPAERVRRLLGDGALRRRLVSVSSLPRARIAIESGRVTLAHSSFDFGDEELDTTSLDLAIDLADAVVRENETASPDAPMPEVGYRSSARVSSEDRSAERARLAALAQAEGVRESDRRRRPLLIGPSVATIAAVALSSTLLQASAAASSLPIVVWLLAVIASVRLGHAFFAYRRASDLGPDLLLYSVWGMLGVLALAAGSGALF